MGRKRKLKLPSKRIDVHCHFFNRKEISFFMVFDILRMIKNAEIYLAGKSNRVQNDNEATRLARSVRSSASFFLTALKSSKRIFKTLQTYESDYRFVPLMLDIFWVTQSPKTNEPLVLQGTLKKTLINEMDNIINSLQETMRCHELSTERRKAAVEIKRLTSSIKTVFERSNFFESETLKNAIVDNYQKQEKELIELAEAYPDDIMPFYSVDPRRASNFIKKEDGTYDISPITNRLRINGGHFYGFKLYTPCGFSPTHPMLIAMYAYCEQHNVPIITHCSGSGVTTLANSLYIEGQLYKDGQLIDVNGIFEFEHKELFSRERIWEHSERLNHPMLWEAVLEKYPNLHLDLAHFGNLPNNMEWTNYIWRMMKKKTIEGDFVYPNLYTDLACIPTNEMLANLYENYFLLDESLQCRFLYGSDYYMNLVYLRDMNDYCNNFKAIFSEKEFDLISIENPRKFLSLPTLQEEIAAETQALLQKANK